jgi:hypothetical protein
MEITEEEFGGTRVILRKGDNLRSVPRSHRRLLTAAIESWWQDPFRAVRNVAARAVSPRMGTWFRAMAERGQWQLELHKASHGATRAGFWFLCPGVRGAEVAPPTSGQALDHLPPDLAAYYRLVGSLDWMGFGASGGLEGSEGHTPLTAFGYDYHGAAVEPARTYVFGWSPCGDMIIYTADGRGGWLCHENGKVHLLGSVRDTIDWVYDELLANRCPNFDYGWS